MINLLIKIRWTSLYCSIPVSEVINAFLEHWWYQCLPRVTGITSITTHRIKVGNTYFFEEGDEIHHRTTWIHYRNSPVRQTSSDTTVLRNRFLIPIQNCQKNVVFFEITRFLCALNRKMPTNKNGSKLYFYVYAIYETWRSRGPPTPHGSPTTRDPADFFFSIL